jgi:RNA polymerase sigma-B factor
MRAVSSKRARSEREHRVESHLPLVQSVARRYVGSGESLDDLVQVGSIGLVKAANRFDESRGVAFAAFAAPVIEGEIRRHLRDRSAPMRIPREEQRAGGELREQRERLSAAIGHSPSTHELASALDIDEERIERALRAELARKTVPLPGDGERQKRLDDPDQPLGSEERLSLVRCMGMLDERQRKIIFLRFHADLTERQIGRELGISQAQVSRLLSAALARLRAELADADDDGVQSDSAANSVISPAASGPEGLKHARKTARIGSGERAAGRRIDAVPVSQEGVSVAQYLELPYTVAVQSERDGERAVWNATVEELPGCAAQGRTPDEAVESLRGAMESWIEAALAQRREVPVPGGASKQRASSSHSGRFLVRMPGALHTELAQAAEREHLSLNRFMTKILAAAVAPGLAAPPGAAAGGSVEATEQSASHKPSRGFRVALAANVAVVVLASLGAIVLLVLALQHGI